MIPVIVWGDFIRDGKPGLGFNYSQEVGYGSKSCNN
jgi:hypothetical protein